MAEKLSLSSPPAPPISLSDYEVAFITLNRDQKLITIGMKGNDGSHAQFQVGQPDALPLIRDINNGTINLSVKSLERRIIEYGVSKGWFSGTITGAPD